MTPKVHAFFDEATNTITYVVQEPQGQACAVVDSVLAVLKTAVRQNPGVYGEFVGLSNGDFLQAIGVRRDAAILRALAAPPETELAVRVIQRDAVGQRTERWQFLDAQDRLLSSRSSAATYSPLDRPWYLGALRGGGASVSRRAAGRLCHALRPDLDRAGASAPDRARVRRRRVGAP